VTNSRRISTVNALDMRHLYFVPINSLKIVQFGWEAHYRY